MELKSNIKRACGGCPFKRVNNNEKPNPGGSKPEVYLGQARGPFWLPCHNDKNYKGKSSSPATVNQCAGAAIFRANIKVRDRLPEQLQSLPEDHVNVFSTEQEFYQHYYDADEERAARACSAEMLDTYTRIEMEEIQRGIAETQLNQAQNTN